MGTTYLIFQPVHKTISTFSGHLDIISKWESKGLSNERFWLLFTTSKSLSPKLVWYNSTMKLKFKGSYSKQEGKAAFSPKKCGKFFYCL